ncbi:MAG TPA: tetratricopeptide repeat protein [Candidatus Eremiobacteraeota bacterium]|nr:MAG: TPR repeat-containing protein YrrB [bacterium ADurb.Bin363]HPZ07471.1 tetratricopeptide repeat protein [Candidatus Eremiobacteraeota bacterium]
MAFSDESQNKQKPSGEEEGFQEMAGEELDSVLKKLLSENYSIDYIENARRHISEGNPSKALEEYEKAIRENPENPIPYQCIGNFYADEGNFQEAILNYQKALQIEEALPITHNNLGLVYAKTGNLEGAINEFKEAIDLAPQEDQFLNNTGNVFAQKGNFKEAINYLKKAISLNPSNLKYKFNLAFCFQKDNQKEKALKIYKEILKLDPVNKKALEKLLFLYKQEKNHEKALEEIEKQKVTPWLLYEKGMLLQDIKKYDEAFSCLEKAISLEASPKNLSAFEILGYTCLKTETNRPDLGEKIYKKLIEIEPQKKEFYNTLGISMRKQGKLTDAIEVYKKGININSEWGEIRQSMGNVYADMGKYTEALEEFQKATERNPDDPWIYGKTGHIYQLMGEYNKGIECFEKALELNPTLAEAYISKGVAYYYLDNMEEAESNFFTATIMDPLNVKSHNCWIETLVQQKNLKKAIERYEKEVITLPDYAILHYALGLCSFYRYQLDSAVRELDRALKLNPEFPEGFALRGNISYELKKIDEAISYYEHAQKLDPYEITYDYTTGYFKRLKKEDSEVFFKKTYEIAPGSSIGKCALAFMLIDKGEEEQAIEVLKEAININIKYSEPHFILGLIYETSGKYDKAIDSYEKAYKLNPLEFDAKRSLDKLRKTGKN